MSNEEQIESVEEQIEMLEEEHVENPAVKVAKELQAEEKGQERVYVSYDGLRFKLAPVSAATTQRAMDKIDPPPILTYKDKNGRQQANPSHPKYLQDLKDYETAKAMAAVDVQVMLGIEILDPIETDLKWLKQLTFLEQITQKESDIAAGDEFQYEFLYKYHRLYTPEVATRIGSISGVTEEQIAQAVKSFQD